MRTVDELIASIPLFVTSLRSEDEWYVVQDRDIGEDGLDLPYYVSIDHFCQGGYDCDWDEVTNRFEEIQEAAHKEGAYFMQSDGNYTYYYMYVTKPMTPEEIEAYLEALEGPRAPGVRRHVAKALEDLNESSR